MNGTRLGRGGIHHLDIILIPFLLSWEKRTSALVAIFFFSLGTIHHLSYHIIPYSLLFHDAEKEHCFRSYLFFFSLRIMHLSYHIIPYHTNVPSCSTKSNITYLAYKVFKRIAPHLGSCITPTRTYHFLLCFAFPWKRREKQKTENGKRKTVLLL